MEGQSTTEFLSIVICEKARITRLIVQNALRIQILIFPLLFRARYSVLYLGAAIPSQDQRGIESIQEPLSKRYPVDGKETVHGKKS